MQADPVAPGFSPVTVNNAEPGAELSTTVPVPKVFVPFVVAALKAALDAPQVRSEDATTPTVTAAAWTLPRRALRADGLPTCG